MLFAGIAALLLIWFFPRKTRNFYRNFERHTIVTKDGYQLILFSSKVNDKGKRILLLHGCMMSSDVWCLPIKSKNYVLFLIDLGYQVWLANFRGSHHSFRSYERWSFSLECLIVHDMPAILKHVAKSCPVDVIAFSQATLVLRKAIEKANTLALLIDKCVLLGTVTTPSLPAISRVIAFLDEQIFSVGGKEKFLSTPMQFLTAIFPSAIMVWILRFSMRLLFQWNLGNIPGECFLHLYSGTSTKLIADWISLIRRGSKEQLVIIPKSLSLIGANDCLSVGCEHEGDKNRIIAGYEHLDFLWSTDNEKATFPVIEEYLEQAR